MQDVLVVDDDRDLREVLVEILLVYGHRVTSASDGVHGFDQACSTRPDVILTDIDMPILDGPGMVLRLHGYDRGLERIPIILVSGAPDLQSRASQVGTPYFLSKPYVIDELLSVLERALAERIAPTARG
jgi:CheY-like chemotaxis protein